jgi:tellurite resistance protein TerC
MQLLDALLANPTAAWWAFGVFVAVALAVDLFLHRRVHVMTLREALFGSAIWIGLGLLFNLGIFAARGPKAGTEFLTGYIIELSLSVDNLFVFMLLFRYFRVPSELRHNVLFWGILGAVVMRLAFVMAGVALLERFHFVVYVFGAILLWSGIKMFTHDNVEIHPEKNPILRLFARFVPMTPDYEGARFTVVRGGLRLATPLLLVLVMIEATDLVFAVDSIPAVLAVTTDPFIVFSSNIFAILGLRALYFSLSGVMELFHYLHYGLAAILAFVGVKMLISDLVHIPTPVALGVVVLTLLACVVASMMRPRPPAPEDPTP